MLIDTRGERAEGHAAVARPRGDRTDVLDLAPGVKIEIAMCEQHIDESVGDGFETAISRDDRRPAVDPRGAAADDALIAAIADADADRRSFGELDVGAAAQPARAHGDLGTVCDRKRTRLNSSH